MKTSNTWGGHREGSGAKRKGEGCRVVLSCRVSPKTAERITNIANISGKSKGEVLDYLVHCLG